MDQEQEAAVLGQMEELFGAESDGEAIPEELPPEEAVAGKKRPRKDAD